MLFTDVQNLPGVFTSAPYDRSVNGSLWTLPWEIRMYIVLIGLGVALTIVNRFNNKIKFLEISIVAIALISFLMFMDYHSHEERHWFYYKFTKFLTAFFLGGSLFVFKKYIILNKRLSLLIAFILIISFMINEMVFFAVYMLLCPYLVLILAYLPKGFIRKYNQLGDISYGTYIYAWPIQQTLAISIIGISPYIMMIYAVPITFVLATFSWLYIEKPMMNLKKKLVS